MRQLPHDLVRTLAVVAETGTLEAASRVLDITASAVSQRVKALEEKVGRVLLIRSKPVRLTEAGRTVVEFAHRTELLEQDALRSLGFTAEGGRTPSLALLLETGLAHHWLTALGHVNRTIAGELMISEDDDGIPDLLSSDVSAALTTSADAPSGWTSVPLGRCRLVAVAVPELRARTIACEPSSKTAPGVARYGNEQQLDAYASLLGGRAPTAMITRVRSERAVCDAVLAGLGWGMIPEATANPLIATGRLEAVGTAPGPWVEYYWHRWNVPSALLDECTAQMLSAARATLDPIRRYRRDGD